MAARVDAALLARVDLAARGEPLEDVLRQLSSGSGETGEKTVRLSAVPHLRERRVTVLVRQEPLGDVLRRFASLFSLPRYPARWVRDGDRYELRQDVRANEEGSRSDQADFDLIGENLSRLMTLEYRPVPLSPEQLARERRRLVGGPTDLDWRQLAPPEFLPVDPRIGRWNTLWGGAVGAMLRELPPGHRAQVLAGRSLFLPTAAFSAATQDLLFVAAATDRRGRRHPETRAAEWETLAQRRERFGSELVGLRWERDPQRGAWSYYLSVQDSDGATIGGAGYSFPVGLGATIAAERGKAENAPLDPVPFPEREKDSAATRLTAEQRMQIEADGETVFSLFELQQLLHRVLGKPIVADYYSRRGNGFHEGLKTAIGNALKDAHTLEGFLDIVCRDMRYRWRRDGEYLLFRSGIWWLDDQWEVPPSLVRQLVVGMREKGYLSLPELALLAELREEQLKTLETDYLPRPTVGQVRGLRGWLLLYGSLGATQRERISGEDGISLGELPPYSRALVLNHPHLARELRTAAPDVLAATRVRIYQRTLPSGLQNKPAVETVISRKSAEGARQSFGVQQVIVSPPKAPSEPADKQSVPRNAGQPGGVAPDP